METCSRIVDASMIESRIFGIIKQKIDLPACSHPNSKSQKNGNHAKLHRMFHTGLSIGLDYWSQTHTDEDCYFTSLTVCGGGNDHDEVVQNFAFPEYRSRVPMRSGEVLLFNSEIEHSCTNARRSGTFIISGHNSGKSVRARTASIGITKSQPF